MSTYWAASRTHPLTSGRVECSACRREIVSWTLTSTTHRHLLPRCTHHHRFLFFWSGLARRTACKPSLLLPMKRYNPRSSVHHHIHYHHHHTSVLFLHVREYFQPSLNEVTIRVPTGRGPGDTARTARRSLMRHQDVTAFRSPVNPLLPHPPFCT